MKSEGPAFAFFISLGYLPYPYAGLPRRIIFRRSDCSVFPPATGSRSKSFPAASRWRVRNNLPHTRFSVYTPDAFFQKKSLFFQFFFLPGARFRKTAFFCFFAGRENCAEIFFSAMRNVCLDRMARNESAGLQCLRRRDFSSALGKRARNGTGGLSARRAAFFPDGLRAPRLSGTGRRVSFMAGFSGKYAGEESALVRAGACATWRSSAATWNSPAGFVHGAG